MICDQHQHQVIYTHIVSSLEESLLYYNDTHEYFVVFCNHKRNQENYNCFFLKIVATENDDWILWEWILLPWQDKILGE